MESFDAYNEKYWQDKGNVTSIQTLLAFEMIKFVPSVIIIFGVTYFVKLLVLHDRLPHTG